jgi:hypothetical protein
VKGFCAAVGRGDKQGPLAFSAEHINRIEDSGFRDDHTESSRKYDAQSFTRLAKRGGWDVAELWTDADLLFAVFGLVAAEPAQGS